MRNCTILDSEEVAQEIRNRRRERREHDPDMVAAITFQDTVDMMEDSPEDQSQELREHDLEAFGMHIIRMLSSDN